MRRRDSNWRGLPPPVCTSVQWSVRLAARPRAGFARRRLAGMLPLLPAIFLDAQQGTSEKIQFQRLSRHQTFQIRDATALPFVGLLSEPLLRPGFRLAAESI